jgi:hypothetical protein
MDEVQCSGRRWKKTFPGGVRGTADPSLRDDNKERVVVERGRLIKERAVANGESGC